MTLKKLSRNATIGFLLPLFALFLSVPFSMATDKSKIKLGVMEGHEATIWKVAGEQAKKAGLEIELVYFLITLCLTMRLMQERLMRMLFNTPLILKIKLNSVATNFQLWGTHLLLPLVFIHTKSKI